MSSTIYHYVHDFRAYAGESPDKAMIDLWRPSLRRLLFLHRRGLSDLTFKPLGDGFEMHEGLFPRSVAPKGTRWHHLLYAGPNCFLLLPSEHQPDPPDRVLCYWLAVVRYGKKYVDQWINSLPFKSPPPMPWRGTRGIDVITGHLERDDITKEGRQYFTRDIALRDLEGGDGTD